MHSTADINPAPTPPELCGYRIERALAPDLSYLAIGPGGRRVVLKRVDEDCLLRNKLHPSIKDRLGRVRELAHGGTTVLLTTEYLNEAEQLADRIAILHEGRILVNGTLVVENATHTGALPGRVLRRGRDGAVG